jgi:citrate lyase subunit beta/citryl-CoA lyase
MAADIDAVAAAGIAGIYLPKATPGAVAEASQQVAGTGMRIITLIESAEGLFGAREMAQAPLVSRLAVGEADLGADLGIDAALADPDWQPIRLQVVVASAAAGLAGPVGPVLTDFRNDPRLRSSTIGLKRIGFGARAAIHPQQVAVINRVFLPTAEEVAAARELIALFDEAQATGAGVMISTDGTMADEATVRHARLVLVRADEANGTDPA